MVEIGRLLGTAKFFYKTRMFRSDDVEEILRQYFPGAKTGDPKDIPVKLADFSGIEFRNKRLGDLMDQGVSMGTLKRGKSHYIDFILTRRFGFAYVCLIDDNLNPFFLPPDIPEKILLPREDKTLIPLLGFANYQPCSLIAVSGENIAFYKGSGT